MNSHTYMRALALLLAMLAPASYAQQYYGFAV